MSAPTAPLFPAGSARGLHCLTLGTGELLEWVTGSEDREVLAYMEHVKVLRHNLDVIERETVRKARAAGATWQQVADALGISRQAAHAKFTA